MISVFKHRPRGVVTWLATITGWLVIVFFANQVSGAGQEQEEVYDLPGFGIWGPAYKLRNIPEGQRLVVRADAQRQAPTVGSLPRLSSEILVLDCFPEITPLVFEDASREAKRELLGGVWCRIDHYGMTGYVPGIYLDPILDR